MTKEEYEKICRFIDEEVKTDWVSTNYQRHYINLGGVARIKDRIKQLVKE